MIQIIEAGTYQIGNQLETSCVKIDLAKGVYIGVVRSNMNIQDFSIKNGFGLTSIAHTNFGFVQTFHHPVHIVTTENAIQIWSQDGFFLDIDISKHQQLYEDETDEYEEEEKSQRRRIIDGESDIDLDIKEEDEFYYNYEYLV